MDENSYEALALIVGENFISDRPEEVFFYSQDGGTQEPKAPDCVVMPRTTEEVQKILILANDKKIPVVPMGAALVLSGLSRALKGGILLDLKRMNSILEVNEISRYALVETGVSEGMLKAHLEKNYPRLKHSLPDAPPMATIGGNILIHGSGHMSQATGFHSEMLNGLEVVLPTGEICRIGSCSTSPYWFSRAPLPDLAGLFVGWNGTTGVVTKLAIKLYAKPSHEDVMLFVVENPDYLPDIIYKITGTEMAEDLVVMAQPKPDWIGGFQLVSINLTGNSEEDIMFRKKTIRNCLDSYIREQTGGFMHLIPDMKKGFLEAPQRSVSRFADVKKGGGFEYVGAIMPIEFIPQAYREGIEIAERNKTSYSIMIRIIGRGHCMMVGYAYGFNRADEEDVMRARRALHDANECALKLGGIPWKAELPGQKLIIQKMDPNSFQLISRIKKLLDPNGIMNPGNWEAD
jgi:glycolate oxidase